LFELFKSSQSISKRRGLLEVFNDVVKAYIETTTSGDTLILDGLQAHSGDAFVALLRALINAPKPEVSFRLVSLDGLVKLTAIRNLLPQADVEQAVEAITEIVLHEHLDGHGDIRAEAIDALTKMAYTVPSAVSDKAMPAFVAELPDVPQDDTSYVPVLEALAKLSSAKEAFDTIVLRLKNRHTAARQQGASKAYQQALLMAILYAFTHGSPAKEDGVIRSSYFSDYAEPLIRQIQETPAAEWDAAELEVIGLICNTLLRSQISHFQSTSYNTTVQWLSPSAEKEGVQDTIRAIAPFSIYYYAAIRPEVVETTDILNVLKAQVNIVLSAAQLDPSHGVLLRHITLLINKFANPKTMQSVLREADLDVDALLSEASPTPQQISLSFAVVKALLIQGKSSALTSTYLQLLLNLLPTISASSARLFTTLLAPDDILSKQNHCAISGLYKQKAFSQLVSPIVTATRTASAEAKQNYLLALSALLAHLPYALLEPALPSLVAPLLQTLDLRDSAVKASSLLIFESLLMHSPTLVAEHAASLITRLLNSTTATSAGNTPLVRSRACQCLALVPKQLKREAVLPFRRQIVKKLSAVLDDRKRSVRSEAVKCRTAWLALEEAEEEE
jgi:DNA repair/transcription protein MET18/MMS19